jgi:type I restriction enzyme S subunit
MQGIETRLQDLVLHHQEKIDLRKIDSITEHYSIPQWFEGVPSLIHSSEIKSSKFILPDQEHILVSRLNPSTHKTWKIEKNTNKNLIRIASTEWCVIIPREKVPIDYVLFIVNTLDFKHKMNAYVTGTTNSHQRVNSNDLLGFKLPNIGQSDMINIANIAANFENKIKNLNQECKILKEIACTIFKTIFGQLPLVYSRTKLSESHTRLWDSAEFINGISSSKLTLTKAKTDSFPVIKISELIRGMNKSTSYATAPHNLKYFIEPGEIILSWSGNPETSIGLFIWADEKAILNQHIFRVVSINPIERTFNYFNLNNALITLIWCAKNRMTAGLGHFTKSDLQALQFSTPSSNSKEIFHLKCGPILDRILFNMKEKIRTYKKQQEIINHLLKLADQSS